MNEMFNKENYKYLGLVIATLLVIYIVIKTFKFQTNILEGMKNKKSSPPPSSPSPPPTVSPSPSTDFILFDKSAKDLSENIKTQNDKLNDIISIDKYRNDYENLLIGLEEYTNNMMLGKIVSTSNLINQRGIGKNITLDIIHEIEQVNTLKTFIDNLNISMKYLDRKKTSTSYF